ncbi:DNA-directed RNA polymerase subunit D [Candidatus Woesearchaeota archaeon]|nr:DNA-directed RNA polymerase subunit D [Candidatus Woesearchaeota archaeon]
MKIKQLAKKDNKLDFEITGSTPAYANTIRRSYTGLTPTMAVEIVEFRKNSSILYDETIAHRLGLLVLSTDLKSYNMVEDCKCKGAGCAQCQLKLILKAKGPKTVYASDLKSKDPKVKPVHPKTLIVNLLEDQELELEATAVLGIGKTHSKWTPGIMYYQYMPKIKILKPENAQDIADNCPKKVFEVKSGKLTIKKLNDCNLCGECEDISAGQVKIESTDQDFLIKMEGWGQLDNKKALITAADEFDKKLDTFVNLLKKA